jgi:hypothetical protein
MAGSQSAGNGRSIHQPAALRDLLHAPPASGTLVGIRCGTAGGRLQVVGPRERRR